ncbi:MAG: hypothetical protein NXH90_15325 [Flavobacteriaceae bacterium]|nr:hypothetical protein [Flavobacteriaceae bacterium]
MLWTINSQACSGRIKSEAALCRPQGWLLLFCHRKKGSGTRVEGKSGTHHGRVSKDNAMAQRGKGKQVAVRIILELSP